VTMNYYQSNFYETLPGHQLSQSTSVLRSIVAPGIIAKHANPETSISQGERRIFSKRGLAAISYAISAVISGGIWLGVFRTAEHFLN
jgi:hypothetical protein